MWASLQSIFCVIVSGSHELLSLWECLSLQELSTARGALPFISKDLLASSRWTSSAAGGGPGEGGHQCCCVLVGGGVLANVIPGESTDVKRSLKCAKEPSLWLLLEDRARVCLTHLPLPFTLHHHHQHLAVWPWASSSPV